MLRQRTRYGKTLTLTAVMMANELIQLIATGVTAFAALVAAGATVWYAVLTKRLWVSTEANVALTKRTLERDDEPFCGISQLVGQFSNGVLTVEFEIRNAGRAVLKDVYVSSTWKGFDGAFREQCTYGEEWIGVLFPGESSARRRYTREVIRRDAFAGSLDDVLLYVAFFLRFQGTLTKQFAHVVLCSYEHMRGFYVRKSLLAQEGDEWFLRQGHLLDDVSSIVHRGSAS